MPSVFGIEEDRVNKGSRKDKYIDLEKLQENRLMLYVKGRPLCFRWTEQSDMIRGVNFGFFRKSP